MNLSKNNYRKFLIDEIVRCSNSSIVNIIAEVDAFYKSEDFNESYKKWKTLQESQQEKYSSPRPMKDILAEIFHDIKI